MTNFKHSSNKCQLTQLVHTSLQSVDKRENSDQKVCKDQRDVIYSETIASRERVVLLLLLLSVERQKEVSAELLTTRESKEVSAECRERTVGATRE